MLYIGSLTVVDTYGIKFKTFSGCINIMNIFFFFLQKLYQRWDFYVLRVKQRLKKIYIHFPFAVRGIILYFSHHDGVFLKSL